MKTRRVFAAIGPRGHQIRVSARLPADATPADIRNWREDARSALRKDQPDRPEGFAQDAVTYLEAVTAMPTYKERVRDIGLWIAEFGATPRDKITPIMIRTVRDRWLTVGPRLVQKWIEDPAGGHKIKTFVAVAGPLSASTVNHRLRALENVYTVLNGRHGDNPVREVPEADEPRGLPREIPAALVRQILWTMEESKTKARLAVMLSTGFPHATLARLTAADFDPAAKTIRIPGRKKGKGTRDQIRPLTSQAVADLKLLHRLDGWGTFARSSLRQSFLRAAAKAGVTSGLRVYDLRATFGSQVLRATGDLRATQKLLDHSTPTLTERYAESAVDPALAAAVAKFQRAQHADSRSSHGAVLPTVLPVVKKGQKAPKRAGRASKKRQ